MIEIVVLAAHQGHANYGVAIRQFSEGGLVPKLSSEVVITTGKYVSEATQLARALDQVLVENALEPVKLKTHPYELDERVNR